MISCLLFKESGSNELIGVRADRCFALGHIAGGSECPKSRCSGNESGHKATFYLLLNLFLSINLWKEEHLAFIILLTCWIPLSLIQIEESLPDGLIVVPFETCRDRSIKVKLSFPNQSVLRLVIENDLDIMNLTVHINLLSHSVAKVAWLLQQDFHKSQTLTARPIVLEFFSSIPGKLLVPVISCIDKLVGNPVLLRGSNLKPHNLLNLPWIFDPPFVSDGSCLVKGYSVVVSIVSSIVRPVRKGASGVAIVARDCLWGFLIDSLASLEIRLLPVPDSCALFCLWRTINKVVFHGHGFHIEVAAHRDLTFIWPKFDRPIGVFDPEFSIHTLPSVGDLNCYWKRLLDHSLPSRCIFAA